MPHKRDMYRDFCNGVPLCEDIHRLASIIRGMRFDGIIGGIPCQSRSKLRAIRDPKFPDLLTPLQKIIDSCKWDWCLFENVAPLNLSGPFDLIKMNAMHYGKPHQSRERWFTYSRNLDIPHKLYNGTVDDLMAYPVVAGRIYGPKRGSILQGWPEFMQLSGKHSCVHMQEALADGVPRGMADAWIRSITK